MLRPLKLYCLSAYLGPVTNTWYETTWFTTYDASPTMPLIDTVLGRQYVSGELAPAGPGLYRADYCVYDFRVLSSYGSLALQLPAADADLNGVPDILQSEFAGSAAITGTVVREYPQAASGTASGRLTRPANSQFGAYTFVLQSGTNYAAYSGELSLLQVTGQLAYTRWPTNQAVCTLWATNLTTRLATNATTNLTFTVLSPDEVQFPGETAGTLGNRPLVLKRSGKRYLGKAELQDGLPATSWRDYTQWIVQIDDPNDADANGIPDLTDTPAIIRPTFTQARRVPGILLFRAEAQTNTRYHVQSSVNLASWLTEYDVTSTTNWLEIAVPTSGSRRFYRLAYP